MNPTLTAPATLTPEGCRARQRRLAEALRAAGRDGAILTGRERVHHLTGFWSPRAYPAAVLVDAAGPSGPVVTLVRAAEADRPATTDATLVEPMSREGTLIDQPLTLALLALTEPVRNLSRLASDAVLPGGMPVPLADAGPILLRLARHKLADEVAMYRTAVAASERVYERVRARLAPGVQELDLLGECYAGAVEVLGEPIGEIGNDFQFAAMGGPARRDRAGRAGELYVLDLGLPYRGHNADLCRTFSVNRSPTPAQREAHALCRAVLDEIEFMLVPGARGADLHRWAIARLANDRGWSFGHHLGHGVSLVVHDAPRLNRCFDDVLQPGDLFTVEPGLYGPGLHAGIRLEQMYFMTDRGAERLSSFPLDL